MTYKTGYRINYQKFPIDIGNFFYTSYILPMDLWHKILYYKSIVLLNMESFLKKHYC